MQNNLVSHSADSVGSEYHRLVAQAALAACTTMHCLQAGDTHLQGKEIQATSVPGHGQPAIASPAC